jgi:tRNA pseudouridine38-40 synthase
MMSLRNIKIVLQYMGTNYHGWQIQDNASSVQQVLEEKFSIILNESVRIIGAGRTDAGVHALAQVANFKTANPLDIRKIFRGVNSLLPDDIAILEMDEVDLQFNARKIARKKEYLYQIWNGEIISPFMHPFAKHAPYKLDTAVMKDAARVFLGEHDFSSFCSAKSDIQDKVRTVFLSDIEIEGLLRPAFFIIWCGRSSAP